MSRFAMLGLRLVGVDVVTPSATIVVTAWRPTWLGRLLRRGVEMRTATSLWSGSRVFEWDDSRRVLSDREHAVVTAAVDRARRDQQLAELARQQPPHFRLVN